MPPKLSLRAQNHITAKTRYRDLVDLAKQRNPKLMGDNPEKWDAQFAFIQGYLDHASESEAIARQAAKRLLRLRDTQLNGGDVAGAYAALEEVIMRLVDAKTEPL